MANVTRVISEYTLIHFELEGQSYIGTPEKIEGFIEGLWLRENAVGRASIVFKNTFASNSTIIQKNSFVMNHCLRLSNTKGPFTAEQFLQIVQFKKEHSWDDWNNYLEQFWPKNSAE